MRSRLMARKGKTVDYVLFSDSTIKAATNAQQWYVTISRGRRGIRIFTPDKEQLRENLARSGHRPLAMEFASEFHRLVAPVRALDRLHRPSSPIRKTARRHLSVASSGLVVITINLHKNMNTKSPECWASDPQASRITH